MRGIYHITMVLPAWTVENELTLLPRENGQLDGQLDTLDPNNPQPISHFTSGRWNKEFFRVTLSVGPGTLELVGQVKGETLSGVVVIDNTPDSLTGYRIPSTTEEKEKESV